MRVSYEEYWGLDESLKIIPSAVFSVYAQRADRKLRALTQGREVPEEAKDSYRSALCMIAEELYKMGERGEDVMSESIDGYSVSYAQKTPLGRKLINIAAEYLGDTGLLYSGVE